MARNLRGNPDKGRKRMEEIAFMVNRKWRTHMALPLHLAAKARILRLPFGVFELDWRTKGGAPINRMIRIWGKPSSLKTTSMLKIVRNAQSFCRHCKMPIVVNPVDGKKDCSCPNPRWTMVDPEQFEILPDEDALLIPHGILPATAKRIKGKPAEQIVKNANGSKDKILYERTDRCEPWRCLFIDTEGTIDESWAVDNGVDPKLLVLVGANWAEQVLELTEELIDTREFDLVVLDSLDMLTPGDTLEKAISQTKKVANKAGIMTEAIQKWTSAINAGGLLNRYTPTIFIVCQVRAKDIGKPWASLKPSGGWAIEHGVSLDVKFEPKKYEYKGDKALFGNFGFQVAKSKVGGFPRSSGEFRYWLRAGKGHSIGDTEDLETVVEYGRKAKIVKKTKSNKWVLVSKFLPDGREEFKTKKALFAFLNENPSVYQDIRYLVMSFLIGEDISITLPSEKLKAERGIGKKKKGKKKKLKILDEIET